ncbi:MAG: hypothetical protein IJZ86_01250 [Bacteroides sp.]|nr:hypothetical protein [Bacteroides sp.]
MAETEGVFDSAQGEGKGNPENGNTSWHGILGVLLLLLKFFRWLLWGTKFSVNFSFEYGLFNLRRNIKKFFCGPQLKEAKDLNLVEKISILLEHGDEITDDDIHRTKILTNIHRVFENTKARQRLERWASRVIVFYLLIVLCIVLANYVSVENVGSLGFINRIKIDIPENIMFTILSTTTINIIGLGLIVLRGHFLSRDKANDGEDKGQNEKK